MADKVKLLLAFLLVVAGIASYYYLRESAAVLRFIVVVVGVLLATGVMWTTVAGKQLIVFGKESVAEAKRVS